MVYVALLRGINVGGNNKVDMKKLRATFESIELKDVKTYINSGNVIFSDSRTVKTLIPLIERAIENEFGFYVKVVLRDLPNIKTVTKALPASWKNDPNMKCDVMFLWEDYDKPEVIESFHINPSHEDIRYVPGAILWRIDRDFVTKSSMLRLIGTDLYKNMTIRNCNTVRKLLALMQDV